MKIKTIFFTVLFCQAFFSSCGIRLKGASKADHSCVETFLVGNGILQYFVKPLSYSSDQNHMMVDFTFRGRKDSVYVAKINFTLLKARPSKVDSCKLVNIATKESFLVTQSVSSLNDAKGTRYFSDADNARLYGAFVGDQPFTIVVYRGQLTETFEPSAKSLKKFRKIPAVVAE